MKITNLANLPDALVRAVANDPYVGGGDISATAWIGPPQINVLRRQHSDDLTEDVQDRIWSLLGQAVHSILERANLLGITEQRLYMPVLDWQLSGQFDRLIFSPEGVLQDYKVTSVWSFIGGVKPEWERQLNVLAELCRFNGHDVQKLEIITIYRDWSRKKALNGNGYPPHQVATIHVPLWSPEKARAYIEERVALHQWALAGAPVLCSDEERWYKGSTWAVDKAGRVSALRVLDSEEEAMAWAREKGHCKEDGSLKTGITIVHRPGEYTRCEDYCPVRNFCSQHKNEKLTTK